MPKCTLNDEHAMVIDRLNKLETTNKEQWDMIDANKKEANDKHEKILTRINIILTSLFVCCLMFAISAMYLEVSVSSLNSKSERQSIPSLNFKVGIMDTRLALPHLSP